MATKSTFSIKGRNPDVLTCIANLSNDEVFTPPEFANQMLDALQDSWAAANRGENIWANPEIKFLDPFTKSGVFLREIVTRLTRGLEVLIPDLQERVDHIVTKQVFGIGVTELTSLLARRSVYCSKYADGEHSIANSFANSNGNIWFERTEHTWTGGTKGLLTMDSDGNDVHQVVGAKCKYCGCGKATLDRGLDAETHAYAFIHTDDIRKKITEIFGEDMHFDVIIGNPPYQLSTEGHGVQARPVYQLFVTQAKALDPKFLVMVTPSRWFSGGMGLDEYRSTMLKDDRLRIVVDYPDSNEVFPGTQIKGGVSFFLWDRDNRGKVSVSTIQAGKIASKATRDLLEPGADVFIRYNEAVSILRKVFSIANNDTKDLISFELPPKKRFASLVSSIGAFGLDTTFRGKDSPEKDDIKVYRNGGVGYLPRAEISKESHVIDKWKVFIPRAGSGSDSFPHSILGKPFIGEPGSISSWTYMYIGPFESKKEAENVIRYISTRLFRFLVLQHKSTQDATKTVYTFVPTEDWTSPVTDELLYKKYGLTEIEISFIESMIRPMEIEIE